MDKTKLTRLADIANEYDGSQDPLLEEFFELVNPYLTSYYRTKVRWLGYGGTRMIDDMLSYAWSYIPRQLAKAKPDGPWQMKVVLKSMAYKAVYVARIKNTRNKAKLINYHHPYSEEALTSPSVEDTLIEKEDNVALTNNILTQLNSPSLNPRAAYVAKQHLAGRTSQELIAELGNHQYRYARKVLKAHFKKIK